MWLDSFTLRVGIVLEYNIRFEMYPYVIESFEFYSEQTVNYTIFDSLFTYFIIHYHGIKGNNIYNII